MKNIFIILMTVFFIFIACFSLFIIQETERGIILRFGKVLRNDKNQPIIYNPGLHFKIPFIETIKKFDSRIQTLDIQADRYLTRENKDLIVDSYLKWRIIDFNRYYVATGGGDIRHAEILLKRKFTDRLRSEFGRLNVKDIITDSRGRLTVDVRDALNNGSFSLNFKLKDNVKDFLSKKKFLCLKFLKSEKIIDLNKLYSFLGSYDSSMNSLGIEVVDVRIKKIELPNEVSEAIYQRMRAERESVARKHRSEGKEEAVKIRAIADKTVTETLAEAERVALKLKGEGDAMVIKIFADAFEKDPDFYTFIRILKAYEKSFEKDKDNLLILNSDIDFFRNMQSYLR